VINEAPRGATTHPAMLEMLAELGPVDEVIARGLVARTFQFWDRPSGILIAEFDHAVLARDTRYPFVVQCEQHKLASWCQRVAATFNSGRVPGQRRGTRQRPDRRTWSQLPDLRRNRARSAALESLARRRERQGIDALRCTSLLASVGRQ
jgi:hypothetical protein